MKKLLFIVFSFALNLSVQANELIQYDLRVDGMTCPFCLATSEKALKKIQGVRYVSSNLDSATISVCGPASLEFDEAELSDLFKTKGFTYRSLEKQKNCSLPGSDGEESTPLETQEHAHSGEQEHKGEPDEHYSHE